MGVRIGTNVTATSSIKAELTYVCSNCGKENCCEQRIEAQGYQNGPGYPNEQFHEFMEASATHGAKKHLLEKIVALSQDDVSKRFSTAEFSCRCAHCGHKEPWARMDYRWMEKPMIWVLTALCVSIICLIVLFCYGETEAALIKCAPITVISLILFLAGRMYKKQNTAKREAEIAQLPASAIPHIEFKSK